MNQSTKGCDNIHPTSEKMYRKKYQTESDKKTNSKKEFKEFKRLRTPIIVLLVIIILLLALNLIFLFLNYYSEGAVVSADDGIKLEIDQTSGNVTQYSVKLKLKNTGDCTAKVNIGGETYVSQMGTAMGEEVWTVLDNKYVELAPDESKTLNLGNFKTYGSWHYVIKVHVSWNGGSLELTEILVP
ncbi:MAG: hypothetical protein ACYS6K_24565 [Planctomycetota bacterium]